MALGSPILLRMNTEQVRNFGLTKMIYFLFKWIIAKLKKIHLFKSLNLLFEDSLKLSKLNTTKNTRIL